MKKILYIICLIGATVLVSLRGGNVPWLLFYFVLLLPVMAFVYSMYVYLRFRIVQNVARTVVKGQKVPYHLILANEDYLPFSDIRLNYFTERASMISVEEGAEKQEEKQEESRQLCLSAKERLEVATKMYCKYRGTYPVGVKSVSVTDFLGLFTITYPMREQVRVTARPRIIPLEKLLAGMPKKDPKKNLFSVTKLQELPDFELRQYQPGDRVKYIHWKNSAKAGELLVRKQMPEELFETVVVMDLSPVGSGEEELAERLMLEDKVIEAAVSFVHDYYRKKIPVRVVYMEKVWKEMLVDVRTGFEAFYEMSANVPFEAAEPVEKVLNGSRMGKRNVVIVTTFLTGRLAQAAKEFGRNGDDVLIVEAGELL